MQRTGTMGKRAKSGARLRLHRETMRSLSAQSLKRVAGGEYAILDDNPCPRTNAWTAGVGEFGIVNGGQLCGGLR